MLKDIISVLGVVLQNQIIMIENILAKTTDEKKKDRLEKALRGSLSILKEIKKHYIEEEEEKEKN